MDGRRRGLAVRGGGARRGAEAGPAGAAGSRALPAPWARGSELLARVGAAGAGPAGWGVSGRADA